tara:strand:- start:3531 stop:3980 length:450 start_codon:yes stop_codon:yes gene_type:complete
MVKGACVFDIDKTLTCKGQCNRQKIQHMKNSINACKQNDFKVVVNTARPPQPSILHGIHPDIQALLKNTKVYTRKESSTNSVPEDKLKHMKTIAKKLNVPLQKTVLVDDLLETCRYVNKMGGTAIHVKNESGIDSSELQEIHKFIKKQS